MSSILTINGGSSSLRFALFRVGQPLERVLAGKFERIGLPDAKMAVTEPPGNQKQERGINAPDHGACVPLLVELLQAKLATGLTAIGHRVVHGGTRYRDPQRVDPAMLKELRRISPFDPEHLP